MNHWSDTSGGTPGAGFLPTSADDVYFDANSFSAANESVSIAVESYCKDMDWSGITYNVSFYNKETNGTNKGFPLNIYGSLTLSSFVAINWSGNVRSSVYFRSTGTESITSNGCQMLLYFATFNGIGGKWVLSDDFYIASQLSSNSGGFGLQNGEVDLNGHELSARTLQLYGGIKTLTFGSGTLKVNNFSASSDAGFTINYDTGTLQFGGFYRTSIVGSSASSVFTFYNVTVIGLMQVYYMQSPSFTLNANLIITNQLTLLGENSTTGRLFIEPGLNQVGSKHYFNAEKVHVENCDFYDVIGIGNGDWDLSGITGGAGDGGGNQNIIFTPPKTSYWFKNSGDYSDITKWFSATNGGGSSNRIPMIHDTLIFDDKSFDSISEIGLDCTSIGEINAYAVTLAVTFTDYGVFSYAHNMFRSLYLNALCTLSNFAPSCYGEWVANIDIKDNVFIGFSMISRGTWNLIHNIQIVNGINLRKGYFDMNYYNLSTYSVNSNGATLNMRDGVITLEGSVSVSFRVSQSTFIGTNGTLILKPSFGAIDSALAFNHLNELNELQVKGDSTGLVTIDIGANNRTMSINKLVINAGKRISIRQQNVLKLQDVTANGTLGNPITITSYSGFGPLEFPHKLVNLTLNDFNVEYCNISWSDAVGTARIKTVLGKALASIKSISGVLKANIRKVFGVKVNSEWIAHNSTDSGNNSGWHFE